MTIQASGLVHVYEVVATGTPVEQCSDGITVVVGIGVGVTVDDVIQ